MNWNIVSKIALLWLLICLSSLLYAEEVWIDVRSSSEHAMDSIEGDLRISHENAVQEISKLFPDKSTEISLYCFNGGRSTIAMSALTQAGYTNVWNAGGIDDVRRDRGLGR